MNVSLRISYAGERTFPDEWNIDSIEIRLPRESEISAKVDPGKQFLWFTVKLFDSAETSSTVDQISLTPDLVREMQLTARMFQNYESNYSLSFKKLPDGSLGKEKFLRYGDLPIEISPLPELAAGKCYCIRVVNDGTSLHATFVEATHEPSASLEIRLLNLREVKLPRASWPGSSRTPVRCLTAAGQPPLQLSVLDETELRMRLKAAQEEFQAAQEALRKACDQGTDQVFPMAARRQTIALRIEQLKTALVREQNPHL